MFNYEATLIPDSAWSRLNPQQRSAGIWVLWSLTLVALVAGSFDRTYWQWVVWLSCAHAIVALALVGWRPLVFPAQLRFAYAVWVAAGTFLPHMQWMMYLATVGVAANQLFGWCPMARTLYFLPWNRQEPFDVSLCWRVLFTGPKPGRFRAPPRTAGHS